MLVLPVHGGAAVRATGALQLCSMCSYACGRPFRHCCRAWEMLVVNQTEWWAQVPPHIKPILHASCQGGQGRARTRQWELRPSSAACREPPAYLRELLPGRHAVHISTAVRSCWHCPAPAPPSRMQFYNVPMPADPNHPDHPVHVIRQHVQPGDFLVGAMQQD